MTSSRKNVGRYSDSIRNEAVRLALEIGTPKAAAQLGIPLATISHWRQHRRLVDGQPLGTSIRFTDEVRASAVELAKLDGVKAASKQLGISTATITKWLTAFEPSRKRRNYGSYSKEDKARAIALTREHGPIRASFLTGVPEPTVRAWTRNPERTKTPLRRYTEEQRRAAIQLALEIGTQQAADKLGIVAHTLRTWMLARGQSRRTRFGEAPSSDPKFSWVRIECPRYETWGDLAARWCGIQTKALRAKVSALRKFIVDYLVPLNLSGEPADFLSRTIEVPEFFSTSCPKSGAGISLNNYVSKFLDWVLLTEFSIDDDFSRRVVSPAFHNPIEWRSHEGISVPTESVHAPLPFGYLEELQALLATGPHFKHWEWAQTALGAQPVDGRHRGGGKVAPDWFEVPEALIDPSDPDCVTRCRLRTSTGGGPVTEMWSPTRWVALLVKLTLPLRTAQVRMLDSGELDAEAYICDESGKGRWVTNDCRLIARHGARKAPGGVLRRPSSHDETDVVLYINTNKTADAKLSGAAKGYELPWVSDGPLHSNPFYWLAKLKAWQEKYNPIDRPTSWSELDARHIVIKADVELSRYLDTCFLFRLAEGKKNEKHLPMPRETLNRNWHLLLEKLQRKLAERGETHANGAAIQLVTDATRGTSFPLHSLRVSLITALVIEGKVPLPIMMKVAGHSRFLMTLYYTKTTGRKVEEVLRFATETMRASAEAGITDWLLNAEHTRIVKEAIANSASTLQKVIPMHPANRNAAGWMLMAHGLCLVGGNATPLDESGVGGCYNGGENVGSEAIPKYLPVPGGARNCVRCRWFVTSPKYLGALAAHFNVIAYHQDEAKFTLLRKLE